jgi:hypothetical protein
MLVRGQDGRGRRTTQVGCARLLAAVRAVRPPGDLLERLDHFRLLNDDGAFVRERPFDGFEIVPLVTGQRLCVCGIEVALGCCAVRVSGSTGLLRLPDLSIQHLHARGRRGADASCVPGAAVSAAPDVQRGPLSGSSRVPVRVLLEMRLEDPCHTQTSTGKEWTRRAR